MTDIDERPACPDCISFGEIDAAVEAAIKAIQTEPDCDYAARPRGAEANDDVAQRFLAAATGEDTQCNT